MNFIFNKEGFFYRILGFETDNSVLMKMDEKSDYKKLCDHLQNIYTHGEIGRSYTTRMPALGELIVVKNDGTYYRGRIQSRTSSDRYNIQLIDEGKLSLL